MPRHLWVALQRFAAWIEPALIAEWARLMHGYTLAQGRALEPGVLAAAMTWSDPVRDVALPRSRALALLQQGTPIHCVWSGRRLGEATLDVDHCLPWSLWPCGDLWNLLPADRRVNQQAKRDRLPSAEALQEAGERILAWWDAYLQPGDPVLPQRFVAEARASLPGLAVEAPGSAEVQAAIALQRVRLRQDQGLLAGVLRDRLRAVQGVRVHDLGRDPCAIVTFTVTGVPAGTVKANLASEGINVSAPPSPRARCWTPRPGRCPRSSGPRRTTTTPRTSWTGWCRRSGGCPPRADADAHPPLPQRLSPGGPHAIQRRNPPPDRMMQIAMPDTKTPDDTLRENWAKASRATPTAAVVLFLLSRGQKATPGEILKSLGLDWSALNPCAVGMFGVPVMTALCLWTLWWARASAQRQASKAWYEKVATKTDLGQVGGPGRWQGPDARLVVPDTLRAPADREPSAWKEST